MTENSNNYFTYGNVADATDNDEPTSIIFRTTTKAKKDRTTQSWEEFVEATAQKNLKLLKAIKTAKGFNRFRSGNMYKREFI